MMYQRPSAEIITFPMQEASDMSGEYTAPQAEVIDLYPEPVHALATVLPFERRTRATGATEVAQDARVLYIKPELMPPSQEGIESTKDVLTYMRDMYDFNAQQTWGFDNSDGTNPHVAKQATQARADAIAIANRLGAISEAEDAQLTLEVFSTGKLNSRHLKSTLARIYAMRGLITEQEAIDHWKALLQEGRDEITEQVHADFGMYANYMWSDVTYGRTEIARRHIERLESELDYRVPAQHDGTPGPRGA